MSAPEFSRLVKARRLPAEPLVFEASADERAALARRFGVIAVESLLAELSLRPDKEAVLADGALTADLVQTCAVSGEEFTVRVEEPLALRFVPPPAQAAEEIVLEPDDRDEIEFEGESFDLGEAVAQSLALAIDPYARGPAAEAARRRTGLSPDDTGGPLAEALAALRKD